MFLYHTLHRAAHTGYVCRNNLSDGYLQCCGITPFPAFRQHRFKIVGKNTDLAIIKQHGKCVFHLTGRYHVARSNIHRQRYTDRRIVCFQPNPDSGIIIRFPYIRNSDNLKLHIIGNLYSTDIRKIFRIASWVRVNPLIVVSRSMVARVSSPTIAEIRKPPLRIKLFL